MQKHRLRTWKFHVTVLYNASVNELFSTTKTENFIGSNILILRLFLSAKLILSKQYIYIYFFIYRYSILDRTKVGRSGEAVGPLQKKFQLAQDGFEPAQLRSRSLRLWHLPLSASTLTFICVKYAERESIIYVLSFLDTK